MLMNTELAVLFLISVLAIGFIRIAYSKNKSHERFNFAQEYLDNFHKLITSYGPHSSLDADAYTWLTLNVFKMQQQMGYFGVITNYQPPFQNYLIPRYQILVNVLDEMGRNEAENREVNTVQNALIRYIGYLIEQDNNHSNNLKNPIIWFQKGIQSLLLFPLYLLYWFELLDIDFVSKANTNIIVKIIVFVAAIISFLASSFTIILAMYELGFLQSIF